MFLLIDCKTKMVTQSSLSLAPPSKAKGPNGVSTSCTRHV